MAKATALRDAAILFTFLVVGGSTRLLGEDLQACYAEVDLENTSARLLLGFQAASDEQLVALGAAERHVARGQVAAVVAANDLTLRIEDLHLLHAVVGHVEVA